MRNDNNIHLTIMEQLNNKTVTAVNELTDLFSDTVERYFSCNKAWVSGTMKRYHALPDLMTFNDSKVACENICEHTDRSKFTFIQAGHI